jgi:tripartite-type tricarboxylate transporter receptor subunit TctC
MQCYGCQSQGGDLVPIIVAGVAASKSRMLQRAVRSGVGIILALVFSVSACAIDFPTKPIRLIVPLGAGSNADIIARYLAQQLTASMGQPIVVDNRPGAGSVLGTEVAASSAPDGYTLLITTNAQTANETLIPKKGYVLTRDLVPVTSLCYSDFLLVIHPSVPANNLAEFIKLAKAKPGQMSYASAGNGTSNHLAAELFKSMAGVDIVHIPYKGSAQSRIDMIAGQEQMMFDALPAMTEYIKAGRVKPLATAGKTRSTVLPDVPTFEESGFPDLEATLWLGITAPRGTPPAIIDYLNVEITKVLTRKDLRDEWAKLGTFPLMMKPDEFGRYLDADIAKWARIIKVSGAKVD